jgi:endonuclease YncB( thermonuclease family)
MEDLLLSKTKNNTKKFTLSGLATYAKVISVYDGDSIKCIIPLFNDYFIFDVRLNGIDTSEIHSNSDFLKHKALEARKMILDNIYTQNDIELNASKREIQDYLYNHNVIVWLKCYDFDKYGRVMVDMYANSESCESLSKILLDTNLAYEYHGDTKLTEEEQEYLFSNK